VTHKQREGGAEKRRKVEEVNHRVRRGRSLPFWDTVEGQMKSTKRVKRQYMKSQKNTTNER